MKEERDYKKEVCEMFNLDKNDFFFITQRYWILKSLLVDGYDISTLNPHFLNSNQMQEIEIGLRCGLNVGLYADKDFDCDQMSEIRKGLKMGLNAKLYADKKFSWQQMCVFKNALRKGLDIGPFLDEKYSSVELLNLFDALLFGFNIKKYYDLGWRGDCLEVIKHILVDGVDIDIEKDLNPKDFSWGHLKAIHSSFLELNPKGKFGEIKKYIRPEVSSKELYEIMYKLLSQD